MTERTLVVVVQPVMELVLPTEHVVVVVKSHVPAAVSRSYDYPVSRAGVGGVLCCNIGTITDGHVGRSCDSRACQ